MTETKIAKIPTLQEVDAYEVDPLLPARISKIHNVPKDFSEGLLREAKRMLYLCIVSNDPVAPSDRVDWAWHEMIMFTIFYRKFSDFIGGFIDHIPNPPPQENIPEETWVQMQQSLGIPRNGSPSYNKTKTNYKKFFGIEPDPLYWP